MHFDLGVPSYPRSVCPMHNNCRSSHQNRQGFRFLVGGVSSPLVPATPICCEAAFEYSIVNTPPPRGIVMRVWIGLET